MKLNTLAPGKSRAQAMVEFAIVLPLLLLLIYGLLEAGRLLFIYSTIVTASRQAVRYGSATGEGTTPGVPRYLDCAGIRQAAQRVDFLNAFDDDDILIFFDNPPGVTTPQPICTGSPLPATWSPNYTSGNSTRLIVRIDGDFNPIVPRIVPFIARTVANGNPIRATSARTILTGVEIVVTPPPGSGGPGPGTNQLAIAMTASPATYSFTGEPIAFSYTLTNNGTVELTGITLTTTHGAWSCPGTTLAAGASMSCTGAYNITAGDVSAGSVTAQATALGSDGATPVASNTATVTLTFTILPQLQLAKSASTEYATTSGVITYTFTLTNTGNVDLTSTAVSDSLLGGNVPGCATSLAVGASFTCTGSYTVTSQDIRNDQLINTATATALYGSQTVTSNQASATVYTGPLYLRATASPTSLSAPGTVTYSYELINNTGITLYTPFTFSGYRGSDPALNCSGTSIAVSSSVTCSGTLAVTQTDLDTSASLTNNSVQVVACNVDNNCNNANKRVTSNTDSVSVTLVRTPSLTMQFTGAPNPVSTLGTVITYTYTVTNTGNVTLTPSITDTKVTNAACPGALAPGASYNCTGTYTVTQADMDAGSITNTATASATFAGQGVSSASQSFTVLTYVGPRVRLTITPNPTSYSSAGDFVVYNYTLTNTGSVPLIGPYLVSDNKVSFIDCATATSPLAVAASTSCVGSYAATQADVDTGHIVNSANVTASDGTQTITSNSAMAVVYVPGAPTLTPTPTMTGVPTATSTPTSTPTATNTPVANLKAQLQGNGADDNKEANFIMRVQNIGTVAASNVAVRIYFTLDSGRPIGDYRLQTTGGDAASIAGPTLVSGTTYYYTVSRAASLAAGSNWTVNLRLDLTTGPNNFSSGNDWWHNGTGALPAAFSDWVRVPAYTSGSRVWGNEPP